MTLTQIVGRFIKDYMPKECKDNILVGIFKDELISGLRNSRNMDSIYYREILNRFPDRANSLLNDFCFLLLLRNENGTSIYGVINRIIEDKFYYSLNDYGDGRYNEKKIRKMWRDYIDNYVILPKAPTKYWKGKEEDIALENSFSLKETIVTQDHKKFGNVSFKYNNMFRRRIKYNVAYNGTVKRHYYKWGR